jgi:CRISPR-associated protein Csd1
MSKPGTFEEATMLEPLVRYAERRGLGADPCFEERYAKWAIALDRDGAFRGITPLGDPEDKRWKGKRFNRAPRTPGNELQSGGKSHFLAEAATTVLLLPDKKDKPLDKKYQAKHTYFKDLVKKAVAADAASLKPIQLFLERQKDVASAGKTLLSQKRAKPTDTITFDVDGCCVLDQDDWHSFWRQKRELSPNQDEPQGPVMPCLATGILTPPVRSHGKIKNVGINSMGASLVANDKDAFQSYRLEDSFNAPVSAIAESRYRGALQELVDRAVTFIPTSGKKRVEGLKFLHWTRDQVIADPVALVQDSEEAAFDFFGGDEKLLEGGLLKALSALREGGYTPQGYEGNSFYGCAISGNGGRLVVRDWWETSLTEVLGHVTEWVEDLTIIKPGGGLLGLPKFAALLYALVSKDPRGRPRIEELPPQLPIQLMRGALRGLPLPRAVLNHGLYRHVVELREGNVSAARMALIKAVLNRTRKEGDPAMTTELNLDEANHAYRCGRLLAVFEQIQRAALPNLNAGLVQRFYGAASTTPALVMPRLFRLSKHHLSALSGGLAGHFQKQVEEITRKEFMGTSFPKTLTLEEQGRFALGYYHQRVHRTSSAEVGSCLTGKGGEGK